MNNANCLEFDFTQIAKINAYRMWEEISPGIPVYAQQQVIQYRASLITVSSPDNSSIPFEKDSVSISSSESKGVAGTLFTVKVSWEMRCKTDEDYAKLAKLRQSVHGLLVTCFGDVQRLILTDAAGYDFTTEESDGKTKCTMVLRNGQGICMIDGSNA